MATDPGKICQQHALHPINSPPHTDCAKASMEYLLRAENVGSVYDQLTGVDIIKFKKL